MDDDLEALFTVLEKHTDGYGHPAIITADYAVANPCFDSIRHSNFSDYIYEAIDSTYNKYDRSCNALAIAHQGLNRKVWKPQLHCREHVQIARWMKALRSGVPEIRWAFEHDMISTADAIEPLNHYAFMDAFNYAEKDYQQVEHIVSDATKEFQRIFGYDSKTLLHRAMCGITAWSER